MIARILTVATMLALTSTSAIALNKWEPRPLTAAERAVVLEKLDGYSKEDQDFVIGRMEGTIEKEKAGADRSYDENASIMSFGATTPRGKHLHSVIVELEFTVGETCPNDLSRVGRVCKRIREHTLTEAQKFYNHYYLGCGEPGRTYGRCE